MYLDMGGSKARVQIVEDASFSSKHTGASLKRRKVETAIKGQQNNQEFLASINQARTEGITSIDDDGNVVGIWKLANNSWRYTEGSPIYYHTLEIEETEELKIDRLVLGEITVRPYAYEESFSDDTLTVEAKALLTEDQRAELRALLKEADYFPVVRYGINDEPMEMRFGPTYWSEHDEGIKHELLLFEKKADEASPRLASVFRWMIPMRHQVAENAETAELLLSALVNKGVLTEEEVEKIRADTAERRWNSQYKFYQVEDVDSL